MQIIEESFQLGKPDLSDMVKRDKALARFFLIVKEYDLRHKALELLIKKMASENNANLA